MTATKDQERKALEQIRKIVEGLGADSYIGTAFEGCFEIAEDNIENDFANSMKEQRDNGQKYITELETKVATLTKKISTEEANAETLSEELEKSQEWAEEIKAWNDEKRERIQELENEKEGLEEKTEAQAQEIMKLKAKLYDFMTAWKGEQTMKIRIEVYVRANGNLMRTMEKNLVEYTDWVYQATRRGYTFEEAGNNLIVHGGKGKWDFLVLDINKEPNSDPYNPLFK